jgi:peptidoglycan/xylan/chitin deacetylase (PgdA/CDA1 family)
MYHSISEEIERGVHPYYEINTSPERFEEHIKYLYDNNYSVVNLTDVTKLFASKNNDAAKCVVLTFDDGYHDFYTHAFPILQEYTFTATVFLSTAFISNGGLKLKGKEHLNWNEVKELFKAGISFGSHTVTHPQLNVLRNEEVENELKFSKVIIEDYLGESITTFSYPGRFPEEQKSYTKYLKEVLEKCGYLNCVTTKIGVAKNTDDILFLKRIPLNSYDDLSFFKAKLEGGYEWLHRFQYIYKLLKSKYKQKLI